MLDAISDKPRSHLHEVHGWKRQKNHATAFPRVASNASAWWCFNLWWLLAEAWTLGKTTAEYNFSIVTFLCLNVWYPSSYRCACALSLRKHCRDGGFTEQFQEREYHGCSIHSTIRALLFSCLLVLSASLNSYSFEAWLIRSVCLYMHVCTFVHYMYFLCQEK